jgi:glycosyltransferase involved in cell wall biosynthesis
MAIRSKPLLGDTYIKQIYAEQKVSKLYLLTQYLKRILVLLSAKEETLWVEKEFLPFFPFWFEQLLRRGRRMIVDYDDATFHVYDNHPNKLMRFLLGRKIDKIMATADVVVAGNSYIADRAKKAGASHVVIVPSVIDISKYSVKNWSQAKPTVIGWIGSPSSQKLLESIFPVLEQIARTRPVEYRFVGVHNLKKADFAYQAYDWSEETEVDMIKGFDIGIMPIENKPFQHGKCGFKLIQYLACGVPIVGTPIGVNQDIILMGKNGFPASTELEWVQALNTLLDDPVTAAEFGKFGRRQVEEKYCIQAVVHQLQTVLSDAT